MPAGILVSEHAPRVRNNTIHALPFPAALSLPTAGAAINQIVEDASLCKFQSTNNAQDEIVLFNILQVRSQQLLTGQKVQPGLLAAGTGCQVWVCTARRVVQPVIYALSVTQWQEAQTKYSYKCVKEGTCDISIVFWLSVPSLSHS